MADRFSVANSREDTGSRFGMRDRSFREEQNDDYENQASQIRVVPRDQFIQDFAKNYTPSHVTLIGPTQRGKTTLCFELLHAVLRRHPKWRLLVLHGKIKGRDHTIEDWARKSKYRVATTYPPGPSVRPKNWKRNTRGVILRPLRKEESAKDEERVLKTEFVKGIRRNYHSTGAKRDRVVITLVDERAQADKDLRLTADLDAPLQRGLPDNPEWNNIQRGAWVSYHCYDAPEHIFLFKSDDSANEERYAEFGCADPKVVLKILNRLTMKKVRTGGTISQCLYMRRSDRFMCIVDT